MLNRIYRNIKTKRQVKIIGVNPGWIQVEYIESKLTVWYSVEDFNRIFKQA